MRRDDGAEVEAVEIREASQKVMRPGIDEWERWETQPIASEERDARRSGHHVIPRRQKTKSVSEDRAPG